VLRETLIRLADLGRLDLVVDMSDATFVDSTVIGVLIGRLKALRGAGGSLRVVCQNENVLRTFEVAGIQRAFVTHGTLPEALAAAAGDVR
jgi:anti-sigma B factor antagonist